MSIFLNDSLDNSVEDLKKNDYHHVSQKFNANELDLVKQKAFFLMIKWLGLKNSKEIYLAKIIFIIHELNKKLVIKLIDMLYGKYCEHIV